MVLKHGYGIWRILLWNATIKYGCKLLKTLIANLNLKMVFESFGN